MKDLKSFPKKLFIGIVEWKYRIKYWYKEDLLKRLNSPTIEHKTGYKE